MIESNRCAPRAPSLALAVLAAVLALSLAGCGDKKDKGASQTAAKVNKEEITVHQINFILQQQRGLKPEQADAASRQILERLIDQQLALQKAEDMKLDRDPRVVQQIEAAKREIVARAYAEKVGEAATKPTADEVKKYYDDKPALFSQRRIYSIQELNIEAKPEQVPLLREKITSAKTLSEFIEYLKSSDIKFVGTQAVRAAEQIPLPSLEALAKLKDGQAIVNQAPAGIHVVMLAGSRSQPVTLEQAKPAIEQFLVNDRKRKLVEDDIKALRGTAKIEYVGKFVPGAGPAATAPGAASAASSAAVPQPVEPASSPAVGDAASPAASGPLSADDINKGLGLKK